MVRLIVTAPILALLLASASAGSSTTTLRKSQHQRQLEEVVGTVAPSELSTTDDISEPVVATVSPTADGTALASSLPSGEAFASVAPQVEDEPEVEAPPLCIQNPHTYAVGVDIQTTYADDATEAAGCTLDEQSQIDALIRDTLNKAFATTVPSWDGQAVFGDVTVDPAQQKTNRQFGVGRRLRNVRTLQQEEQSVCFARATDECLASDADLCRWSCLEVDTTYCGSTDTAMTFDDWSALGDAVMFELATIRKSDDAFGCLGVLNDLEVIVKVDPDAGKLTMGVAGDDGIDGQVDRVGHEEEEEEEDIVETTEAPPVKTTPAPPTLAEVLEQHEALVDAIPETCNMIKEDPCISVDKSALEGESIDIQSSLAVKFFTKDIPNMDILDGVAAPWFEQILRASKLKSHYVECSLRIIDAKSNFEPSTETLTVTFDTNLKMKDRGNNDKAWATALTRDQKLDFHEYLDELRSCGVYLSEVDFDLFGTSR